MPYKVGSDPLASGIAPQGKSPSVFPLTFERIPVIDVLRGVALFGVLAGNMRGFFSPLDAYLHVTILYHRPVDVLAQMLIATFVQGKFLTIFSFLFGLGFAIQMSRGTSHTRGLDRIYFRRILVLALFGFVHGTLIWAGDILLTYSAAAAALFLFRNRQQGTLLCWAAGLSLVPMFVRLATLVFAPSRHSYLWHEHAIPSARDLQAIIDIYVHGSAGQIVSQNWAEWKHQLSHHFFASYALGVFLIGVWVWRAGVIQQLESYQHTLKRIVYLCIPIGLILNGFSAWMFWVAAPTTPLFWRVVARSLWMPGSEVLSAGYVAGVALIVMKREWHRTMRPFEAAGRMALTNYLLQSIACTLFFEVTGLYGKVGPAVGLFATMVVYAIQVIASNWWMRGHYFGPFEWLSRSLAYWKLLPLRRTGDSRRNSKPDTAAYTAASGAGS